MLSNESLEKITEFHYLQIITDTIRSYQSPAVTQCICLIRTLLHLSK